MTPFSIFPPWDLAFVHKHTTLQSFTLPHTSTTVIQTAERWQRLRINCFCIKSFINNVHCCFLLLPAAARGWILWILSVISHFSTVTAQVKTLTLTCQHRGVPGNPDFWNATGTKSHSHTPSALKRPLITASQQQEKAITELRDWRKIPLDTNPPEVRLFLN